MALPVGFVTTAGCQTILARVRYCAISVDFKVEVGGQDRICVGGHNTCGRLARTLTVRGGGGAGVRGFPFQRLPVPCDVIVGGKGHLSGGCKQSLPVVCQT
ncbi:uncharacterized [Tachysurus ichikawai]